MLPFLIILFISPIILFFILVFPQFIWSFFNKRHFSLPFGEGRGGALNKLYGEVPKISFSYGNNFTEILVQNFRNAKYGKSEWDNVLRWENKKFKLEELESLDILVDHYAHLQSHVILIFNFLASPPDPFSKGEGVQVRKLCISYEPKKKDPENFKAYKTFYQNFEAGYMVGSFEDLVGLRYLRYANFDHKKAEKSPYHPKNLNIYKTNFTKNDCLAIFQSLAEDINLYSQKAFFYNFIYRSCLSEIFKHFRVTKGFDYFQPELFFVKRLLKQNKITNF